MPEIGTSSSMSGDRKRSVGHRGPKPPRLSSTLPSRHIAMPHQLGRGRCKADVAVAVSLRWGYGYTAWMPPTENSFRAPSGVPVMQPSALCRRGDIDIRNVGEAPEGEALVA